MPVRSFNPEQLSKKEMVSLDYDGIRLVYPNTTFGPGFGHAIEGIPKTQESDEAFYQNILSDIGKSPYSIFKRLPVEERRMLIDHYQVQCMSYGGGHKSENDSNEQEENLQTHDFHESIEKTVYETHATPLEALVEPDIPHTSSTVTEKKLLDWQRVHDAFFKDTPQCRNALQTIVDSIDTTDGVVDFVLLTYKRLHDKYPGSQGEKDYVTMMDNYMKIVQHILNAFLSYVSIIGDEKIDDVSLSMRNFLQDCSKTVKDVIDLYKNMNITMHCVNLMKVIMVLISKRYRQILIITNSDICMFVETYKDLFVRMFTMSLSDSTINTFFVNHIDHMINIEVICHLIHKIGKKHHLVAYNNMQSRYVDAGIKKKQLKSKLYRLQNNPLSDDKSPSYWSEVRELQKGIADCDNVLQSLALFIAKEKEEGVENKIRSIKLLYRSNFHDTMGSAFFDFMSTYKKKFKDYKEFNEVNSTVVTRSTIGKSFVDGTSNEILFATENKSLHTKFKKFGQEIVDVYFKMEYEKKVYFMTEVTKLFNNNENKAAFKNKYKDFKEDGYMPFENITVSGTVSDYLDDLEHVLSHPEDFISYVTLGLQNDISLTEFKSDLKAWLSDDKYKEMLNILKRCMSLNRMIVQCLTPIARIKLDEVKSEEKDLYLVRISHLKVGDDGLRESANFFMKRLCYTIKYIYFGKIFDPTQTFSDEEHVIKPLKNFRKKFPKFDVDKFLDDLHLYDFEYEENYPSNYNGDKEFRIYIGIQKRSDLMTFFHIMYSKTLNKHTLKKNRQGNTYFLRGVKNGDGEDFDENVFYTVDEKARKDEIQIDLVVTDMRDVPGQPSSRRLIPKKVKANSLSYEGFKLLDMCMKSFYIFLQNYYNLPTTEQGVTVKEISQWKKQAKYTSMFLIDLANEYMQTNSRTLHPFYNIENWKRFAVITREMSTILTALSNGLEKVDYSGMRSNSTLISRLQPMIYFTYRKVAINYYPSIFNKIDLPKVHYLNMCLKLESDISNLQTWKSLSQNLFPKVIVIPCTSATMPDYYKDCMDFVCDYISSRTQ